MTDERIYEYTQKRPGIREYCARAQNEPIPLRCSRYAADHKTIADSYFTTNANNEKYLFDVPASTPQQNKQETYIPDIPYKIVGTLFNTYLLIESQDSLYMIDQHAGHERILYDKFTEMFNQKKLNTQDLLLPYLFEVNQIEKNLVEDNLDVFKELDFGIEQFGNNSFRINVQ